MNDQKIVESDIKVLFHVCQVPTAKHVNIPAAHSGEGDIHNRDVTAPFLKGYDPLLLSFWHCRLCSVFELQVINVCELDKALKVVNS